MIAGYGEATGVVEVAVIGQQPLRRRHCQQNIAHRVVAAIVVGQWRGAQRGSHEAGRCRDGIAKFQPGHICSAAIGDGDGVAQLVARIGQAIVVLVNQQGCALGRQQGRRSVNLPGAYPQEEGAKDVQHKDEQQARASST